MELKLALQFSQRIVPSSFQAQQGTDQKVDIRPPRIDFLRLLVFSQCLGCGLTRREYVLSLPKTLAGHPEPRSTN
jgi:hypothetical protein